MSNEVKCPYCSHELTYEEYYNCHQDETVHIECENKKCEKTFTARADWDFSFMDVGQADCLNGGEHVLKNSLGLPEGVNPQYRCKTCGQHGNIEQFKNHVIVV